MERKNKILKFLTEKKKIVIPLAVVAVCVIGFSIKNETSVRYETQPLTRCTITQVVEASGTINPVNTVSVGSTVSGLMKEIYVDYNSEVKKGQLLAQMDPTTFQSQLEQNEAQIINAEATLAKLNAEMVYAQKTYNRYKNLYSKNFIARSELDQAESDYLAKKPQ